MAPSSMLTRKKKSNKKRKLGSVSTEGIASLYMEDLGTAGIKELRSDQPLPVGSFSLPMTAAEKKRRKERKSRFGTGTNAGTKTIQVAPDPLYSPLSAARTIVKEPKNGYIPGPLVGTNRNLEKPYLRLTDFPKKEDVRPLEVLIKSLAHIKQLYIKDEDFEWANEQLKSVRQDITVQRIRNRFVLDVYETHARILLEHGDLNEFNQCQTVIRTLTLSSSGLDGISTESKANGFMDSELASLRDDCVESENNKPLRQTDEAADEFRGYSFLYALVRNSSADLKTGLARTREVLAEEGKECHRTSSCYHALQVVTAVSDNDYKSFFQLYESAPHMSAYLMDFLVKRVRDGAYERIIAAYRPTVSLEYFRECLYFQDLEETRRFLRQNGALFVEESKGKPPFYVDCKASSK